MRYVRFLRSPTASFSKGKGTVDIVITVTTDLGESFLWPESSLGLTVRFFVNESYEDAEPEAVYTASLRWKPGMRALKTSISMPANMLLVSKIIYIGPADQELSAGQLSRLIRPDPGYENGLILPVWSRLTITDSIPLDVCFRRLQVADGTFLELEEDIGESIARHIWDAGIATVAFISRLQPPSAAHLSASEKSMATCLAEILFGDARPNILELGCGVGILGLGIAAMLSAPACHGREATLLMTDVDGAEERATGNILRYYELHPAATGRVTTMYQNLDWERGRLGHFGNEVKARRWNLAVLSDCTYNVDMLPALVGTLTRLHLLSKEQSKHGDAHATRVFLATKPRHNSEEGFFGMMKDRGWSLIHHESIPMKVLYEDDDTVELYLFEMS